jgi:hypothetical protein
MRSFLASRFELPDYAGRIVPFEGLRGFAASRMLKKKLGQVSGNTGSPVQKRSGRNAVAEERSKMNAEYDES